LEVQFKVKKETYPLLRGFTSKIGRFVKYLEDALHCGNSSEPYVTALEEKKRR
jgi:hypothetical protein